ncbi:hypothetical protein CAPTEDRAFT_167175 [Capitella teleta]|uniref:BTB domain-containing protein n=1 Tax=Capitella teleta TaxID=283909 RepID=R7UCR3_CAPTE|nr:hypothetical protein CAPTEDRAFT_167175 [Capitella teleta]|eukprot:ELU01037.1 hypothetical protein CAPTEDRAFT_167175 [Capitella teleta]
MPIQEPFLFKDANRNACLLRGFKELHESSLLFDVTLIVDSKEFECHRSLLASSSDYFRCMFTSDLAERDQREVSISGVDATSMELVIKYMYSGEVKLQASTVQNLLSAANLFQLSDLKEGCAVFMGKKLDVDNCIGIHFFAQAHECGDLEFQAWDVITEHFEEVAQCIEFLDLSAEKFVEIIQYDDLQASEEDVYEAALAWLQHSPEERTSNVYDIFRHVRFSLMDEHYFYDRVKNNTVLQAEPRIAQMFDEVIRYKLLKNRWMEIDLRLEPRYGADFCRVAVYTAYLDDEKKQVLQLYGQRSDEVTRLHGNVLCDLPSDIENPALLVTGNNDLYVAGGDQCSSAVYKWCSEDVATFDEIASMTIPRKRFCLVQLDKYIYALGGCNLEGNLSSVIRYSEDNDEWESVASMPKALRCFCAVAYCGKLYVFGGESEKVNKKVLKGRRELNNQTLCYDPRDDKWTTLAQMTIPRALSGCTVYKNKIYVIGGFGSITESWIKDTSPDNVLDSVEVYDPVTNSWEVGVPLPIPLCAMGIFKYYGTIYVMGGENEEDVSNSVYYLSDEGVWELKDEMVTGVTEITIHSSYAILNVDVDAD